jgi:hypothetical protein
MIDPLTVLLVALALVLVRGVVQVRALRAQASALAMNVGRVG